jgi:hypothetical protein
MTTKEIVIKWGVTTRQVQLLCVRGHVDGAIRFGAAWVIPADANKPIEGRARATKETKHKAR